MGRTQQDLFPPETAKIHLDRIHTAFETGSIEDREDVYHFGDREVWLNVRLVPLRDEAGRVTSLMGLCRDITARKQAEEALKKAHDELEEQVKERTAELMAANDALRESEGNFRTLVETLPDAVVRGDLTGHIIYASCQTLRMYGTDNTDEILARNPLEFFAPEDHESFQANLQKTLEEGVTRNVEYNLVRKNGTRFVGETSAAVLNDVTGKPKGFVAIFRDVTERKQAEEALKRERQSLWNMLQASDHERQIIAYDIHDGLSQYLAAAGMQFQVYDSLKENSPDDARKAYETAVELVRQAHIESRRLISEVRHPVIDERGLETAITSLAYEQRQRGGPRIECHTNVDFDRLPPILENALYRMVQEALTNACTHSKSKKVKVTMIQEGQDVRLEVQDWGIGFDTEAILQGHFGLESIRQRVRLLGGRLTIQSQPGNGTLVRAVVPIVERQEEQ